MLPQSIRTEDFVAFNEEKAKLGRLLFYDPILSGNRNISCGTCHHHNFGGSDGISLGIGEGGSGLGPQRNAGQNKTRIRERIARNAPALWNLGALEVEIMFHDGRVSVSDLFQNGFNTPAEEWLPKGLDHVLAAQALFPLISQFEMAGNPKENEIAGAIHNRIDTAWPIIAKRVRTIPEYGKMFTKIFDDVNQPSDVKINHIVNKIAAFEGLEWKSFDSPFDKYLEGEHMALTKSQKLGMKLFFGKARCSSCHSGKFFTDQKFYSLGLPQFGPGRTRKYDPYARDVGHMAVSDLLQDSYRFRTPSLRNIELTKPYGHNGAYPTLKGIIKHHLQPREMLSQWDTSLAKLPKAPWLEDTDFVVLNDIREQNRLKNSIDIEPLGLDSTEIQNIVFFLYALTGSESIAGRLGVPDNVPSGLEVAK